MIMTEKDASASGTESNRVKEMPECLRPREMMERMGVRQVSDDVLLAILLRSGVQGRNVVELSRGLLQKYGSLSALASASISELCQSVRGLGRVKAQVLASALEIGRRMAQEQGTVGIPIRTPADVLGVVNPLALGLEQERFWVLHLDAKSRLKRLPQEVSVGLLDASLVHPREVFREAIRDSAASVVVAHNHPSGDATPSAEDLSVTRQLVDAGRLLSIRVLDHVIVGRPAPDRPNGYLSLRESGLVSFDG